MLTCFLKALGVDTEDDIYLLSSYFLNRVHGGPGEGDQAQEEGKKEAEKKDMEEEKGSIEEITGVTEEGGKKDDEGSVVLSVDEKESQSSSVKAHMSGLFAQEKLLSSISFGAFCFLVSYSVNCDIFSHCDLVD